MDYIFFGIKLLNFFFLRKNCVHILPKLFFFCRFLTHFSFDVRHFLRKKCFNYFFPKSQSAYASNRLHSICKTPIGELSDDLTDRKPSGHILHSAISLVKCSCGTINLVVYHAICMSKSFFFYENAPQVIKCKLSINRKRIGIDKRKEKGFSCTILFLPIDSCRGLKYAPYFKPSFRFFWRQLNPSGKLNNSPHIIFVVGFGK